MEDYKVRVLDQYVLIKQIMKQKKSLIIRDAARLDKDKFDYSWEIVQLGNKVERDIKIGEHPIFTQHVSFAGFKVLEKSKTGMVSVVIVHENDIVSIDEDPEIVVFEPDTKIDISSSN